jgi:hypothetical protein
MIHLSNIENCKGSKIKKEVEETSQSTLGFQEDMLCPKCYEEYLKQLNKQEKHNVN